MPLLYYILIGVGALVVVIVIVVIIVAVVIYCRRKSAVHSGDSTFMLIKYCLICRHT